MKRTDEAQNGAPGFLRAASEDFMSNLPIVVCGLVVAVAAAAELLLA